MKIEPLTFLGQAAFFFLLCECAVFRCVLRKVQGVLEELCQLPVAKRSGAGRT